MIRAGLFAMLVGLCPGALVAQQSTSQAPGAVLRALNKLSGVVTDIEIKSGQTQRFERLTITLSECRYPAGNRSGDAYAGLEITDINGDGPVFRGWMIASAPALSALDHAQYDVWVMRCITS